MKKLGVEIKMEGIKKIGTNRKERRTMIIISSDEEKRKKWRNKGKL